MADELSSTSSASPRSAPASSSSWPARSGLLRFPDALSRLHALTKADNLGLGLVVLGLLPRSESLLAALKLVAIWALVQLAGATAAQLVGRAVRRKGSAA